MININTRFITLIGTPLSQSFAARMQNAAYDAADINMRYFYTETDSEHLGEIINGIRYMPSFAGAAVTKPNKVKVLQYLDELDPLCEKMGACNTIMKLPDGKLRGYNTDGIGFYTSITTEAGIDVKGETFFCIGAGGAGRAICSVLAYYGAKKIYITSLYDEETEETVEKINRNFGRRSKPGADANDTISPAQAVNHGDYSCLKDCDMIINASGVGMGKSAGTSPVPKEHLVPGKFYFDACYNPEKTQFLMDAESIGGKIMNGLSMSLYQGVTQIRLWSGKEAPVEVMRQELKNILEEKNRGGER